LELGGVLKNLESNPKVIESESSASGQQKKIGWMNQKSVWENKAVPCLHPPGFTFKPTGYRDNRMGKLVV
jgi:hypothetical protein